MNNNPAAKILSAIVAVLWLLSPIAALAGPAPPGFLDASTVGAGYNPTDVTATLQSAINSGQDIWVPNMGTDWVITPIILTRNNQEIRFEEGVVVSAKAGSFLGGSDTLFLAASKHDVTLSGYGATFRMRQDDYTQSPYPVSEHRHAVVLSDATNFDILGITIEDTGGDGIYVGAGSSTFSQNVTIKDVTIDNAYRNGISVISADGVLIEDTVVINTSGTSPQSGIDIEPNFVTQTIQNIVIRDSVIMNNAWFGITWNNVNIQAGQAVTGTMENVTFYGNGFDGALMYLEDMPGVTATDSLYVNNGQHGFAVCNPSTPGGCGSSSVHSVDYSAFWGNSLGPLGTFASLGTGSITGTQPIFMSTTLGDPNFMYLDPSTSSAILEGAQDGSYMGARGLYGFADFNNDGTVDVADFNILYPNMLTSVTPFTDGDVNGDGFVGYDDFDLFKNVYYEGTAALTIGVPEPTTLALFVIAMLAWLPLRLRRSFAPIAVSDQPTISRVTIRRRRQTAHPTLVRILGTGIMVAALPNGAGAVTIFTHEDAVFLGGANAAIAGQWPAFALGISSIDDGSGGDVGTLNNFGTSSHKSYLKFDLSTLSANAANITFEIDRGTATGASVNVYGLIGSDSGWDDATTSWNTAPGNDIDRAADMLSDSVFGGAPLGSFSFTGGTTLSFDSMGLANYINSERVANGGDDIATLILTGVLPPTVNYNGFLYNEEDTPSKEGRLQIEEVGPSIHVRVNKSNGRLALVNEEVLSIDFDAYGIQSPSGLLDPFTWNSLEDQGKPNWVESNPTSNALLELNLVSSEVLVAGGVIDMGTGYTGGNAGLEDLTFFFSPNGGSTVQSSVEYVLAGDMNGDGSVDIADSPLIVQAIVDRASYDANAFTTTAGFPVDADFVGDIDGNGIFDLGDVGSFSALLGGPTSASAVPEPTSVSLLGIALGLIALSMRWSRKQ